MKSVKIKVLEFYKGNFRTKEIFYNLILNNIYREIIWEIGYDCSRYRQFSTKACYSYEIKERYIVNHLKEFLKFTKKQYLEEIENTKIELRQERG